MKYWLFDGKEATGPFEPEELKKVPGFTTSSLIAPDGADTANDWKAASYYLIKPPTAKPDYQSFEKPKVTAPPVVEADVVPAPAPAPIQSGRSPIVPITLGLAALAAVGGGAYYARQKKMKTETLQASTIVQQPALPAPVATPAPAATKAPAAPAAPAAVDEAAQTDALGLVQKFKIASVGGRYPANPFAVLSPKKWKAPKTLGELYELRPLEALSLEALQEAQRRGQSVAQAAKDIRKDPDGWKAFSQKFLKNAGKVKWETQAVGPDLLLVTAHLRSPRTGAPEHRGFEADLKKRAIKPADFDAWCDLDAKACAKWARANLKLGEAPDPAAVAATVRPYVWPRLKTKLRPQAPGTRPTALDEAASGEEAPAEAAPTAEPVAEPVAKASKPARRLKRASAAPPPQTGDADDFDPLAAGQEAPPEHTAPAPQSVAEKPVPAPTRETPEAAPPPKPATDGMPGAAPHNASATPSDAVPPMTEKPAGVPSAARPNVPPSPGAKKSVTEMSVDELEKYLNRKD